MDNMGVSHIFEAACSLPQYKWTAATVLYVISVLNALHSMKRVCDILCNIYVGF
jgi:hypothetical protein